MAVEIVRQPIYDTMALVTDGSGVIVSQGIQFFAIPQGQNGKTLVDTNVSVAGQLPYEEASVVGLRFDILSRGGNISAQDMALILNNGTLSFKKEDRIILECPLYMIPSGMGITGFASTTDTTTTIGAVTNGMAVKTNFFDLYQPETFSKRDRLQFTINLPAITGFSHSATFELVVVLESLIKRLYV